MIVTLFSCFSSMQTQTLRIFCSISGFFLLENSFLAYRRQIWFFCSLRAKRKIISMKKLVPVLTRQGSCFFSSRTRFFSSTAMKSSCRWQIFLFLECSSLTFQHWQDNHYPRLFKNYLGEMLLQCSAISAISCRFFSIARLYYSSKLSGLAVCQYTGLSCNNTQQRPTFQILRSVFNTLETHICKTMYIKKSFIYHKPTI